MQYLTELESTITDMVQKGRGVLAADESAPTIAKRFKAIDAESTEENQRLAQPAPTHTTILVNFSYPGQPLNL